MNDETVERVAMLPCPFCGGEAHVVWPLGLSNVRSAECKSKICSATGPWGKSEAEAIAAWNARAAIAAMPGWQPIETAPRDGTLFLMRNADHHSFGVWPAQRWVTYEYSTEISDFIARDRGAWIHARNIEPDYEEGHTTGGVAQMPSSVASDEGNKSARYEWQPLPPPPETSHG